MLKIKILQESLTLPDKVVEPALSYFTTDVLVHVSNGQWLRICAFGLVVLIVTT